MIVYTNYAPETGQIYQSGICPNEECLPEAPEGSEWLFGVMGKPDAQKVVDGQIEDIAG